MNIEQSSKTILVILESPNKIKKVKKYLSEIHPKIQWIVKASLGHIRELKKTGYKQMGIELESMNPTFSIPEQKIKIVEDLIRCEKQVDEIILATDDDREGEAISWHLSKLLKSKQWDFKRLKLNSITKDEVENKISDLKPININLVNSSITRQMIDRIIGFPLSEQVRKNTYGLSAGRGQSVVLKMVAELEIEISNFESKEYYTVSSFTEDQFELKLVTKNHELVKFDSKDYASSFVSKLNKYYILTDIISFQKEEEKYIPFNTSAILKRSSIELGIQPKKASEILQKLFDSGLITYARTDSTKISQNTKTQLKRFIEANWGNSYIGDIKEVKAKGTDQEGHPAITPTYFDEFPEATRKKEEHKHLDDSHWKMYQLIFNNTLYSILKPAKFEAKTYIFDNDSNLFKLSLKNYTDTNFYDIAKDIKYLDQKKLNLEIGDCVETSNVKVSSEKTKPKNRYDQASLIEALEKSGVGRPSTYATLVDTNYIRKYIEDFIENKKTKTRITPLGMNVYKYLNENYEDYIKTSFTADMEKILDKIAEKDSNFDHRGYLKGFWADFSSKITKVQKEFEMSLESCDKCKLGKIVLKVTKKGDFKACNNYPECKNIITNWQIHDEATKCSKCSKGKMIEKIGPYGKFISCSNWKECKNNG